MSGENSADSMIVFTGQSRNPLEILTAAKRIKGIKIPAQLLATFASAAAAAGVGGNRKRPHPSSVTAPATATNNNNNTVVNGANPMDNGTPAPKLGRTQVRGPPPAR